MLNINFLVVESIVYFLLTMSALGAIFFSWYYYQKARNKERLMLIERGDKAEDLLKNKFPFEVPWLRLGVVVSILSVGLLLVGCIHLWFDDNIDLFRQFLIAFVLGIFLGVSMIVNHFLSRKN